MRTTMELVSNGISAEVHIRQPQEDVMEILLPPVAGNYRRAQIEIILGTCENGYMIRIKRSNGYESLSDDTYAINPPDRHIDSNGSW